MMHVRRNIQIHNLNITQDTWDSCNKIHIVTRSVLFQEREHHKTELQQIRRENASLDTQFHESDKSINQLRTTVAVLQQEIKDKEQVSILLSYSDYHYCIICVRAMLIYMHT